jgi:hypothetical protein
LGRKGTIGSGQIPIWDHQRGLGVQRELSAAERPTDEIKIRSNLLVPVQDIEVIAEPTQK